MRIILDLVLISVLFIGCATANGKIARNSDVVKNDIEVNSMVGERQFENLNTDSVTENNSTKEAVMGVITVLTFPLWFPVIFVAALFSGVS